VKLRRQRERLPGLVVQLHDLHRAFPAGAAAVPELALHSFPRPHDPLLWRSPLRREAGQVSRSVENDTQAMSDFPSPRHPVPSLVPIREAWARSSKHHDLSPPASDEDLARLEAELGRSLPASFRAIYEMSDGASLLEGNLCFNPLFAPTIMSVVSLAQFFRQQGQFVPTELVIFGGNGSDNCFGLWLPRERLAASEVPVIMRPLGDSALALVGTDFTRFLTGWTAYYLNLLGVPSSAMAALGVPQDLFLPNGPKNDDLLDALLRWADPQLPHVGTDPYSNPISVEKLRERFGYDSE